MRSIRARVDRRGDRPGRGGERGGPHRPRLVAALAPPVALLLADRRLRPAQGAGRGARRRVPAGRARRGVGATLRRDGREGTCHRLRPRRLVDRSRAPARGLGRDRDRRERGRALAPRRGLAGDVHRRARHGRRPSPRRRIEDADAVVVATDGDNTNIIIGQVAQNGSTSAASSCACSIRRARSSTPSVASTPSARRARDRPAHGRRAHVRDPDRRGGEQLGAPPGDSQGTSGGCTKGRDAGVLSRPDSFGCRGSLRRFPRSLFARQPCVPTSRAAH